MSRKSFLFLSFVVSFAMIAPAQQGGGGGGGGGNTGGNTRGGDRGGQGGNQSGRNQNDPFGQPNDRFGQQTPQQQRPIFLSGQVLLDNGNPPSEPVTIQRILSGRLELPPRATISGTIVDEEGEPVTGRRVTLDRGAQTETDDAGCFEFESVEAGVHGIHFPGERFVVVHVEPGRAVELELEPGIPEVNIRVTQNGEDYPQGFEGVIIGLDDLASLFEFGVRDSHIKLRRVVPGRYLTLNRRGILARVEIDAEQATLDVGSATLKITAKEGTRLSIWPEDGNELVEHFAHRINTRTVPESGQLEYSPLPAGRYVVTTDSGIRRVVEVEESGTEVNFE